MISEENTKLRKLKYVLLAYIRVSLTYIVSKVL